MKTDKKRDDATDRPNSLVGCDHEVGYTDGYEGQSIFPFSRIQENLEYIEDMKNSAGYGIVFWTYCPNCGAKLEAPNDSSEPELK